MLSSVVKRGMLNAYSSTGFILASLSRFVNLLDEKLLDIGLVRLGFLGERSFRNFGRCKLVDLNLK